LSLGLETRGGLFVKLISRNSTIPLKNTMTFTTVVDNQATVEIHILQGEREVASGNRSLGKFDLVGIPPAPRGVPQVDVSFEIDANGIVNVSAKDKMTGFEQAMQVTPLSGLAPDEIEQLIIESVNSIEKDLQTKEMIMQRNRLDSLIRNTRRSLEEFGGSIPPEQRQAIKSILTQGEEGLKADNVGEIQAVYTNVEFAANQLTESLMAAV